ncbi:hemerythrin domain-containing protein [Paraglaciecola sp. 20A4]|uniref:hemerythrin domain-containing protein n=1 Tax=Paraglaciecola sp. 20A4 TaxID=2687288 RepID=UPI001409CF14|nr:hemerythrin domain-containing protein [Paraglaciecola sp. 20A4]
MKIFEALRNDHDVQRDLMNKLINTSGKSDIRIHAFNELKEALESHALAEERFFYAPLMESDDMADQSRHAIAEHHEIDELIEKLEQTDMSSSAWLTHMKSLQHLVLHHLDDEEHQFFQMAGKVLNETQKSKLASSYREEMREQQTA